MTDDHPPSGGDTAGDPAEPIERIDTEFFAGSIWPDRVEIAVTRPELSDQDNVEQFGNDLLDLCSKRHACRIMIEMSRLNFMTSSVLGRLIQLHRTLQRESGRLVLHTLSPVVAEVMEATNLDQYFAIAESDKAARSRLYDDGQETS